MPLLRNLFERREIDATDEPWTNLLQPDTAAGNVTPEGSLKMAAVFACVRLLSETVGSLPVHLIRRDGGARHQVDDHPLAEIITDKPNPETDAADLWRQVMVWMALRGNAYVYVRRNGAGRPVELWPLPAQAVHVGRLPNHRGLTYRLDPAAQVAAPVPDRVDATHMLHFRAFGTGLTGLSPVGHARQSVGIGLSAREHAARFYEHDARPSGVLRTDQNLTDEQYERLNKWWKGNHAGLDRSRLMAVLEGGLQWENVGLSPQDAEFIDTRRWETVEIARMFGVPPHLIGDVERSTSWGTGIEQQNIGFVQYVLAPWLTRLEQVVRVGLLRDEGRQLRARWSVDGLLRGDMQTRYASYAQGRQWGWLSTNDVRRSEDMDPVAGGDVYMHPMNMLPAGTVPDDPSGPRSSRRPAERRDSTPPAMVRSHVDRHARDLADYFGVQRDELVAAITASGVSWDADRWDDQLAGLLRRLAADAADAFGREVDDDYDAEEQLGDWLATSSRVGAENVNAATRAQLDDAILDADTDPADAVGHVLGVAITARAAQIAHSRVTTVGQAAREDAAARSGHTSKTWVVTSGNPRETHASLDGETVPVGQPFSNGAQYPGDPVLPVGERAGCTCDMDLH